MNDDLVNQRIAQDVEFLRQRIIELTPPSREQSLALTKLDECEMWAIRAEEP